MLDVAFTIVSIDFVATFKWGLLQDKVLFLQISRAWLDFSLVNSCLFCASTWCFEGVPCRWATPGDPGDPEGCGAVLRFTSSSPLSLLPLKPLWMILCRT